MNWSQEEEDRKKKEAQVAAGNKLDGLICFFDDHAFSSTDGQQDWMRVNITEIVDGTSFYFQPESSLDDVSLLLFESSYYF
jgi:hypothetical protein